MGMKKTEHIESQFSRLFVGGDFGGQAIGEGARLWRLSVASTAPRIELTGDQLVEWGGAQRWLVSDASPTTVRAAATEAQGHATVWHGDKACGAFHPLAPVQQRLQRALKAAFDPEGLFNPGRLDNLAAS